MAKMSVNLIIIAVFFISHRCDSVSQIWEVLRSKEREILWEEMQNYRQHAICVHLCKARNGKMWTDAESS